MIRTLKIHLKDEKVKSYIIEKIYKYRHFENMYLILLHLDYKQGIGDFNLLTNERVMRAVLRNNQGGMFQEQVSYISEKYSTNQLMQDLITVSKELKIHNLVMIMKRVKAQYKGFFTKIQNGDTEARPPKPKKLSKMINYTIPLDSSKSFSLSRKNVLGINLDEKMVRTHVKFEELEKLIGNLSNIQAVDINFSNGEIYLLFTYEKNEDEIIGNSYKTSGLDIGVNNLLTLYVEDDTTPSLIIDGKRYKTYNANFNRFIAKINTEISTSEDKERVNYLIKYRRYLYEKRNRFFFDEFHKLSKRTLEYLQKYKITELVISKNLADLKNNGECELNKKTKQSFIQIPFIRLLNNIIYKAPSYGIIVIEVDESYTSKTSSISVDIKEIVEMSKTIELSTNDFCGSRVKRGLFIDNVARKAINADINGARNICYLSPNIKERQVKNRWQKLCNPIKVESDFELCKLIA